ncbi:hypothetical protein KAFR_0G00490 [Kazachstania africana CBS 2517]|uniref:Major facilitator superfamily (MFS) profile domain-containing protein n=1 Tax=Kazachstania africana (strain ATCC 22294 / BCRC 22015 / CBS 2517 / CECT 1963 / NBRC 1671 / NRRL Y-8276) TaxID=1071382 RepID=H2AXI2_KAZAF|nr:hypothetical protein KAFR_0G00490 [Kazachstania africana CBS 2517]CCF59082.1 hypothetical protein KAFR_0G00490 [Kazachstania africana CBS 2517]
MPGAISNSESSTDNLLSNSSTSTDFDYDDTDSEERELQRLREEARSQHRHLSLLLRPSLSVVSILVILFCLSEMLFVTPLISLSMSKVCQHLTTDEGNTCNPQEVQELLSDISSKNMIISGIVSTFMAGKWGQISDRYGRIHVFSWITLIRILGNLLHVFSVSSYVHFHIWFIIATTAIAAFSGGMFAMSGNVSSYITDIIDSGNRATSMSIVSSTMHATVGLAPFIGSMLIKANNGNEVTAIYAATISSAILILLCNFAVTEPRHKEALEISQMSFKKRQDKIKNKHIENLSDSFDLFTRFKHYVNYYTRQLLDLLAPLKKLWLKKSKSGSLIPRYNVLLMLVIDTSLLCAMAGMMPSLVLFTTYKYEWKAVELGYLISFGGLCNAIVLSLVSPYFFKYLKKTLPTLSHSVDKVDIIAMRLSLCFVLLSLIILIKFNDQPYAIFIFLIIRSLGSIGTPTAQASIIKYYIENTGQIFGAIALLHSLCTLITPPLMLKIYGDTVSFKPEYFIYVPTIAILGSLGLTFLLRIVDDESQTDQNMP